MTDFPLPNILKPIWFGRTMVPTRDIGFAAALDNLLPVSDSVPDSYRLKKTTASVCCNYLKFAG